MAWEETKRHGETVMTGDKPVDEMAFTLKKLVRAYEDRWERKPSLQEIIYTFELVIQSAPETYLSNPEEIGKAQNLFVKS